MVRTFIGRGTSLMVAGGHIDFTADNWFYASFFSCAVKFDNSIENAVVRNSQAIHAQLFCPGNQSGYIAHAVQQAVLGMDVEMAKHIILSGRSVPIIALKGSTEQAKTPVVQLCLQAKFQHT